MSALEEIIGSFISEWGWFGLMLMIPFMVLYGVLWWCKQLFCNTLLALGLLALVWPLIAVPWAIWIGSIGPAHAVALLLPVSLTTRAYQYFWETFHWNWNSMVALGDVFFVQALLVTTWLVPSLIRALIVQPYQQSYHAHRHAIERTAQISRQRRVQATESFIQWTKRQ